MAWDPIVEYHYSEGLQNVENGGIIFLLIAVTQAALAAYTTPIVHRPILTVTTKISILEDSMIEPSVFIISSSSGYHEYPFLVLDVV